MNKMTDDTQVATTDVRAMEKARLWRADHRQHVRRHCMSEPETTGKWDCPVCGTDLCWTQTPEPSCPPKCPLRDPATVPSAKETAAWLIIYGEAIYE